MTAPKIPELIMYIAEDCKVNSIESPERYDTLCKQYDCKRQYERVRKSL